MMTDQSKPSLVHFKENCSMLSASQDTLKQCAERLGVTETTAAHIAINRLHMQLFPESIAEDAPTDDQIAKINSMSTDTGKDPVVRIASIADFLG